jgi:predicted ATP-grasp superfamily ATP-dependent carboligase
MLPTVGENGRFGVVAVGNTPEEADELYERIQSVIQSEAKRVTTAPPLPVT